MDKREKERKVKEHHRKRAHERDIHTPRVSRKAFRRFEKQVDPTRRLEHDLEYLRLLADPINSKKVGIPLSVGGVATQSVKLRQFATQEFTVPAGQTELMLSFMNCSGPQRARLPANWSEALGNTLPKITILGFQQNATVAVLPNPDQNRTPRYAETLDIGISVATPNPALALENTFGRVVAQVVQVYPTSNVLDAQGTMTI